MKTVKGLMEARREKARKKKRRKLFGWLAALAAVVAIVFGVRAYILDRALKAYESGDYEAAVVQLEIFKEKYTVEYSESCYQVAVIRAEEGRWSEALSWIQESGKTDTEMEHYIEGMNALKTALEGLKDPVTYLEKAEQELKEAGNYKDAKQYLQFVSYLNDGKFSKALEAARKIDPELSGMVTVESLKSLVRWLPAGSDTDRELCVFYLDTMGAHLKGDRKNYSFDDVKNAINASGSGMEYPRGEYISVSSLNGVLKQCTATTGNKVLILRGHKSYKATSQTYVIDMEAMARLPVGYIPSSLSEVRYVVIVEYDYRPSPTGDYGFGYTATTKGIQEVGYVRLVEVSTERTLYSSGEIIGPDSPHSFSYSGSPPPYKSGGAPRLGDAVKQALFKIM